MYTLLDVLKENLPEGAVLKNVRETANHYKYKFCFGGISVPGEISKTVSLGYEKTFVIRTIATSMSQICISTGDISGAQHWLEIASKGKL